jgi:hypothetical protein
MIDQSRQRSRKSVVLLAKCQAGHASTKSINESDRPFGTRGFGSRLPLQLCLGQGTPRCSNCSTYDREVLTPEERGVLSDWLVSEGDLLVDVHPMHSGSSGSQFFVNSVDQIEDVLAGQEWPELEATVFAHEQYPVRGEADELLLDRALALVQDGQWYTIYRLPESYPCECQSLGIGDSHQSLRSDLAAVRGARVAVGSNPFDGDMSSISHSRETVMVLRFPRG